MTKILRSPDRYYIALGKVVNEMSHLEFAMIGCMSILAKDQIGNIHSIIAGSMTAELCNMLRSNCRYRIKSKSLLKRIESIIKNIENVNKRRNRYIHSRWSFAKDRSFAVREKSSNRSKELFEREYPIPDIKKVQNISRDAHALRWKLIRLFHNEIALPIRLAEIEKNKLKTTPPSQQNT